MAKGRSAPHDRRPAFQRVADAIRGQIDRGELLPGDQLPTQAELVHDHRVSRDTVVRALKELRDAGIVQAHQGRGTFVADGRPSAAPQPVGGEGPQLSGDALVSHLEEAFRGAEVSLDIFCLTAETFTASLLPILARLRGVEPAARPQTLRIRLLLPSLDAHLAIPRNVDDPRDGRPLERWRSLMRTHAFVLDRAIRALHDEGLLPDASLAIRTVAITPTQKLYLFNGERLLLSMYPVHRHPVGLEDGSEVEIFDLLGLGTRSFLFEDGAFVKEARNWFESVWSTIACDFTMA